MAAVLCLVTDADWIFGQEPASALERRQAVETGLLPAVVATGQLVPIWSIWNRVEHHLVPGLSIAVINGGVVEWAEGYGVKQAGHNKNSPTSRM
jgi:hypothetical protein